MIKSSARGSLYVYASREPLPTDVLEQNGLTPVESGRESAGHTCSLDSCDCGPPKRERE